MVERAGGGGGLGETAVSAALTTKWIGRPYHYYESVTSTNDLAKERVARGDNQTPPAGTVWLADYQSQGRGRMQRNWEAPPGTSLLLSILLRPHWPAKRANWLTMIAAVAMAEAVEAVCNVDVRLKWPNDLMAYHEEDWRKFCGILLEGSPNADGQLESAILGTGVNVGIPLGQLPVAATPATSLLIVTGGPVARLDLLLAYLQRLEARYETADSGHSPHTTWEKRLLTVGQPVRVTHAGKAEVIEGVAEATDEWGQLLVRDETGRVHTIAAGDVSLRSSL